MKKVFLLVIVAVFALMSNACGKKNDDNTERQLSATEQKLVGKWMRTLEIEVDAQGNVLVSREKKCYTFEFFADGKGNWLLDEDAICQDGNNWTKKTIEWKVENNMLILFNIDGTGGYLKVGGRIGLEIASLKDDVFEYYIPITEDIKDFYNPKIDKLIEHYVRVK